MKLWPASATVRPLDESNEDGGQHRRFLLCDKPTSIAPSSPSRWDSDDSLSFVPDTAKVSPNKLAHDELHAKSIRRLDDMDAKSKVDVVAARGSPVLHTNDSEPDGVKTALTSTPNGIRSSPPTGSQDVAMDMDPPNDSAADPGEKSDSEAETIVLPGKDGHSPSKLRKSIKHEDKSDEEEMRDAPNIDSTSMNATEKHVDDEGRTQVETTANSLLGKRKRTKHGGGSDDTGHLGNSSGLSSVPTSPVATTRSSLSKPAASDSEISKSPSPRSGSRSTVRDKAKSVDRVLPRRKQYASGSGDEDDAEVRIFSRPRGSTIDQKSRGSAKNIADTSPRKRTRSVSPHSRGHKRSISSQLPSKSSHGLSHKKKRVPAPLQSTEYHSDESSASGNSHPRSSRLRNLAAPTTGDSAISPAKMAPHKKHVNSSGQTLLAIACNRGKLEIVKQRYEDRPEDLNLPDNAKNTPLHIASLSGYVDIVKFLLDTGDCELDCTNLEKDTPLHDAVDNRNVEVVKMLLDAGANPSKPNMAGNEPLDLINLQDEEDDADMDEEERMAARVEASEMREAIKAAKRKFTDARRGSEDHQMHDNVDGRDSHPKASPRQSPPPNEFSGGSTNRRTARSMMKTKDRNLWKGYTIEELQVAATEGDEEFTNQILNVKPNVSDPRTLYNAARGGHDGVINLLFALGNFNPDPSALDGLPLEQSTPILAAIGKENHLEVIKLFLGNSAFDPTRRIKGETYYEIARRRAGPKWQEEEQLLKEAFDTYQKTHKSSPNKARSPGLRRDGRDADRDTRKASRMDDPQSSRTHKRNTSSPKTKESELKQHKSTSSLGHSKDAHNQIKRGPGRPRKEETMISAALSDRETSPLGPPKQKSHSKKSESDVTVASENEPSAKPRRKLVSGKELRGERELERKRRASIASNASSASVKEKRDRGIDSKVDRERMDGKSSPNFPRINKGPHSAHNERESASDKTSSDKDRARSLKRDDSKDRLTAIRGESPVKRPRKSETPPRSGMQEVTAAYDAGEGPKKRRKLEGDSSSGHKTDSAASSSPEHRTSLPKSNLNHEASKKSGPESKAKSSRPAAPKRADTHDEADAHSTDKSSNRPSKPKSSTTSSGSEPPRKNKLAGDKSAKDTAEKTLVAVKQEEEEEAQRQNQLRREKKEAEALRLKEAEEEKERVEQARLARLAREQAARDEEERQQREEAERKERQRIEDAEAHARAEEERRALYLEQERLKKEEQERRRAIAIEQQRAEKARLEKERKEQMLAKLPPLLKWLDLTNDLNVPEIASLFTTIIGYRHDSITPPSHTHEQPSREQWMLNTHVAILLGEKDLQLSRYTAWERIPLSVTQKNAIWRTDNGLFTLLNANLGGLRKQLPDDGLSKPASIEKNRHLFLELDLFFVKISEFMFIVPNFPHLRSIELKVEYRELQDLQSSEIGHIPSSMKWKQDPDTNPCQKFIPESKYYLNGNLVRQGSSATRVLKEAPPLDRFPRREGITRVQEYDPDFEEECKKRGRYDLIPGYHSSPVSSTNPQLDDTVHPPQPHLTNGITPPQSVKSINGGSPHRVSMESQASLNLPNGNFVQDSSSAS